MDKCKGPRRLCAGDLVMPPLQLLWKRQLVPPEQLGRIPVYYTYDHSQYDFTQNGGSGHPFDRNLSYLTHTYGTLARADLVYDVHLRCI